MPLHHAVALALATATLWLAACGGCGRKTDEELLRERIDTSSVRLYLTVKTALGQADPDRPEVAEARARLLEVLTRWQAAAADEDDDGRTTLDSAELVALGKALWDLRSLGGELLEAGLDGAEPPPFVPALLAAAGAGDTLGDGWDAPTEHAVLMTSLWAFKLHPRSPVPIPMPILLYEAWKTDPTATNLSGSAAWLHTIRAWIFGQEALCDLSARDAGGVDTAAATASALLTEGVSSVGVATVDMAEADAARVGPLLRALAHGSAGLCYLQREQEDEATVEIEAFVTAAEDAGAPPTETALLRAWLAYRKGDIDGITAALDERLTAPDLSDDERATVTELRDYFEARDDGALAEVFDWLFFARIGADLLADELERTGALEAAANAPIVRTLRGFASLVGQVLE